MFKKLTLAAAVGAGYVLGAKAGKERYAQIEGKFREIAGMPAVQDATATVKDTAAPLLDSAKDTVNSKVAKAGKSGDSSDAVDFGASGAGAATGTPAGSTASSRATPAAGAAPSVTAPTKRP
jgi:hypothetical protein